MWECVCCGGQDEQDEPGEAKRTCSSSKWKRSRSNSRSSTRKSSSSSSSSSSTPGGEKALCTHSGAARWVPPHSKIVPYSPSKFKRQWQHTACWPSVTHARPRTKRWHAGRLNRVDHLVSAKLAQLSARTAASSRDQRDDKTLSSRPTYLISLVAHRECAHDGLIAVAIARVGHLASAETPAGGALFSLPFPALTTLSSLLGSLHFFCVDNAVVTALFTVFPCVNVALSSLECTQLHVLREPFFQQLLFHCLTLC